MENDWASDFFSKCLSFSPELSASGNDLYSAYLTYCRGYGIQPLPQTKVMPRIADYHGVDKRRKNTGTVYIGVGVSKPPSMILLDARAGECREENSDSYWEDVLPA